MTDLTQKQKQYIAENYRKMSAREIAEKLSVDKKVVEREVKQITQLPKGKKIIFTAVMMLFPLLFLIGLEIILRAVNYGGDLDLVLSRDIRGTTYCYLNKKVAKRFFSHQDIHVPDARTAVFKKYKSPNTYRIFCLGGSTTAGFPYEFNATFPSLVKDRLDVMFPQKNIEVINVGISAINSYSVLDFTKELAKYDPDLFLIYMGHNEFYGALGIGSTQQIGKNRHWVLFYIKLQKVRLFNLMRDLIGRIGGTFKTSSIKPVQDQTLMAQAVKDRYIGLNSEEYKIAYCYFEKNLQEIIKTAHKAGAQVIISTLVSNLADQQPFGQQFSAATSDLLKAQWQDYFDAGYQFEMAGKSDEALIQYDKAKEIDLVPAMLHFRCARCLHKIGNTDMARKAYIQTKDLDVLRFRASSDFNNIIRQVGGRNNVPVVEMEQIFAPYCLENILDFSLFTDHLHPNFEGYFLMAKAFVAAMAENGCIVPSDRWSEAIQKSDEEFRRMAGVTDLDLEIANQRIRILTSHWPFKQQIILRKNSGSDYDNLVEKTVKELFSRKFGWNEAHYRIARYLAAKGDYDRAAQEYQAVIKVTPSNYYPYLELGDLLMRQRKFSKAEDVLKKGLTYSTHLPYAYAKLGMLYFFSQRLTQAVEKLEQAIEINKKNNLFKIDELAGAYYIMSMAYGQLGKIALAKNAINNALKIKPNYPEAKAVLKKLEAAGGTN